MQAFSAPFALLADAVSYLLSALFLGRVRAEEAPIEDVEGERGLHDRVAEGSASSAATRSSGRRSSAAATLNFFNYAFSALFVLYATRTLGRLGGTLGLVLGAGALGGRPRARSSPDAWGAAIGVGQRLPARLRALSRRRSALVPLAEGPRWLVLGMLLAAEFLSGLGVMILDINVGSIMFALTPDRLRSRATGAFNFVNWGIRPLGALAGGALGAVDRRTPDALGRPASGRSRERALAAARPRWRGCASCRRRPRDRRPLSRRARARRAGGRARARSTASTAATGP